MSERTTPIVHTYLRPDKGFPTVWCEGCGIGIILGAIVRAVESLSLDRSKISMVSGIGCSGRMPVYVDFCTLHATHGRALAFATGLKLARPDLTMLVVMGDGDALAIGAGHFVHAARRNLDMTAIIVNNMTFGMTGGQASPTTPQGDPSYTSAYGALQKPLDACEVAAAAGANFVARSTVYHVNELKNLLTQAMAHKGFSVVEVLTNCHTYYGKMTGMPEATQMLQWFRENTASPTSPPDFCEGKIMRGVFAERDQPEYGESYRDLVAQVKSRRA